MKKNESTQTAAWQPPVSVVTAMPGPQPRQQRERVVVASNQPIDWRVSLIILGALAVIAAFLGYALGDNTDGRFLWGGGIFLILSLIAIPAISGDLAALWETWQGELTERQAIKVEGKRVDATEKVALGQQKNDRQLQKQQHAERMAELTYGNKLATMQEDMAWLQERVAKLIDVSPGAVVPVRHNYVPNENQEALVAMEAWLSTLYLPTGGFNPDTVHGSGAIKASPWKNEWAGKPWANRARKILTQGDFSPLVPIIRNDRAAGYELRYEKKTDAIGAISRG